MSEYVKKLEQRKEELDGLIRRMRVLQHEGQDEAMMWAFEDLNIAREFLRQHIENIKRR